MYIIVTYGKPGIKGIQVRGLRIADCLPKQEVLFINDGDGEWLKNKGYKVVELALNQFLGPNYIDQEIITKYHPKAVIFADMPTNRLVQTAILESANRNKIPSIVFDNFYSIEQFKEKVYKNTLQTVDFMFLNGLSSSEAPLSEKVKIIPPFVTTPTPAKIEYWKKQLELKGDGTTVLTFLGYNEETHSVIKKIVNRVGSSKKIKLIISNLNIDQIIFKDNIIELPFLAPEDISNIIQLSDIVIGKMGYLQFLESLALKKIFVSVGTETGFRKYWLDKKLQEVCFHFDHYSEELIDFLHRYITDSVKKKELVDKISKLHDGSYLDSEKIGKTIKNITFSPKSIHRKLLLYVDMGDDQELDLVKQTMFKEPFVLPLMFYRGKDGHEDKKLIDFKPQDKGTLLDTSFYLLSYFSPHSYHSLSPMYPWEGEYLSIIDQLLKKADSILVIGKRTKEYFNTLLSQVSSDKIKLL